MFLLDALSVIFTGFELWILHLFKLFLVLNQSLVSIVVIAMGEPECIELCPVASFNDRQSSSLLKDVFPQRPCLESIVNHGTTIHSHVVVHSILQFDSLVGLQLG